MKGSKIKVSEIREMKADQIKEKLIEFKKELFNLRFQNEVGQLENTQHFHISKKILQNFIQYLRK